MQSYSTRLACKIGTLAFKNRTIKIVENVLLITVLLCVHIHSYLGVPSWMVGLVVQREGTFFWCPLCFPHTWITKLYHRVQPHNPSPAFSPLLAISSLLMAICCRDNNRGRSWPYDELTLALTREAFLLIHTGTVTCKSTLFDREAQIQIHSDMYTHTSGNTHKRYSSTLPCHVTAQPRWAALSSAMSSG